jgi:surface protein
MEVRSLFPSPLQDRVYFLAASISLLLYSVAALILFLNNALFFSNPFLSLDFSLLLCGAVFNNAGDFNGDLSTWQVGKVTTMEASTYTLPPPLQDRVFFRLLLFPFFFLCSTYSIFEQCSLLFLFQSIFILGLFFVAVVQCFSVLLPSMVISLPGTSGV